MSDNLNYFIKSIKDVLPQMQDDNPKFSGDLLELDDESKDTLCHAWLKCMPSWQDDFLPPACTDQAKFLDHLYLHSKVETLSINMRDDIYMGLENKLRELVWEVYCEINLLKPEEFAGYERGQ
jgi:hypothetical protein